MGGSSRVRLEVAFLDADQAASAQNAQTEHDEHTLDEHSPEQRTRVTVLVVAAEVDVRRYVRECLRERSDLRVLEAATITDAIALAANSLPELLVVDQPERVVVELLLRLRAIVIVDDVPRGEQESGTRVRFVARPFTADGLAREVGQLLG